MVTTVDTETKNSFSVTLKEESMGLGDSQGMAKRRA